MLKAIQRFFETHIAPAGEGAGSPSAEHGFRLATAALLIEMTRADHDVKEAEREAVANAVQGAFQLSAEETSELVRLAELEAEGSTSLYQFTRLINEHFSPEQKRHVVELLWQVAYADGMLDKHEEQLVRKIADLIYVPHRDFMQTKHSIQERLGR